jgi:hypothetical protein
VWAIRKTLRCDPAKRRVIKQGTAWTALKQPSPARSLHTIAHVRVRFMLVNTQLFLVRPSRYYVRVDTILHKALGKGQAVLALAAGPDQNSEARMGVRIKIAIGYIASTDGSRITADSYKCYANEAVLELRIWNCVELLHEVENQAMRAWLNKKQVSNLPPPNPLTGTRL